MKVILRSDVERLGSAGDVVSVAAGYARNFLMPRGFAAAATDENVKLIAVEKKRVVKDQVRLKEEAEALAKELEKISLTISKQSGEEDKLFGSVTNMEIAEALAKENHEIDKRKIILEEPIKALGIYTVPIKIHTEVTANVKLWVVKE
jgi:large subunit ribosomal protein L9